MPSHPEKQEVILPKSYTRTTKSGKVVTITPPNAKRRYAKGSAPDLQTGKRNGTFYMAQNSDGSERKVYVKGETGHYKKTYDRLQAARKLAEAGHASERAVSVQ
jgi:hypothetical protein